MSSLQPAMQNRTPALSQNSNYGTRIPSSLPALPNSLFAQPSSNVENALAGPHDFAPITTKRRLGYACQIQ